MNEVAKISPASVSIFTDMAAFDNAQRIVGMLSKSDLVPQTYRGNPANCLVALEMAYRMNISPFMVMQNLHIIQGRPSFSSSFLVSTVNTCGRFGPLEYEVKELGQKKISYDVWVGEKPNRKKEKREIAIMDMEFIAVAVDLKSGKTLKGPKVTIEMAVREGWYTKTDSKWTTMPDLMGRYRAAAFFVRTYAPEISMGMKTAEEWQDADVVEISSSPSNKPSAADNAQKLNKDAKTEPVVRMQKTDSADNPDEIVEHEEIIPENEQQENGGEQDPETEELI